MDVKRSRLENVFNSCQLLNHLKGCSKPNSSVQTSIYRFLLFSVEPYFSLGNSIPFTITSFLHLIHPPFHYTEKALRASTKSNVQSIGTVHWSNKYCSSAVCTALSEKSMNICVLVYLKRKSEVNDGKITDPPLGS